MLVEPLGSDTLGLIRLGAGADAGEMTGRFPPEARLAVGQALPVVARARSLPSVRSRDRRRGPRRRLVRGAADVPCKRRGSITLSKEERMKTWKILLDRGARRGHSRRTRAAQQTTLRIFTGGQQRPDVMRKIADEYQKRNPEREGRGRGRRRDVRGAAAVPVDGAVVEGLGARRDPDRRDPPGAVGGAGLGRAARRLSRRRQGEDPADVPQGLRRREPGRRQADRAAVLRRLAVPLLPQGPAREVQAAGAEDAGTR